jgi:hypothetical protein
VFSIYDEMNLLDGRILHEIRLLAGAMSDARADKPANAKPADAASAAPKADGAKAASPAPSVKPAGETTSRNGV